MKAETNMKKTTVLIALAWMIAIFVAYYWLKTAEIVSFYLR